MLDSIKKKFKNMKLAGKMMSVYLLLAGISCCISIVALQASLNIYDKKLYEKSLQELDFFTQKVNAELQDIEELSYIIAMDQDIQEHLADAMALEYLSQGYNYEINKIRNIIQDKIMLYPVVENIVYTDRDSVSFTMGSYCGEPDEDTYQEFLQECRAKRGGYVMESPSLNYPYLISGRDILERKNASLTYLGTFILTSDVAGMIENTRDLLEAKDSVLYVYSDRGLVYGDEKEVPEYFQTDESQGYQVINYEGERYFLCYLKSSVNGWVYVNAFPYSQIFGQTMRIRYLMLGGFVLVFVILIFAMRKISGVITNPLDQLTESMKIVENGNFQGAKELLSEETGHDEVAILSQEFAVMLDKIDFLIHENYEKQLLLKDTEYKMLQAQINPHFLYNTLNALNWMVKAGRNQEAGRMIVELGRLLRASFAKEPYITVEEEVENARSYITIQQFRYQKRAEFAVETGGDLTHYMVPRMILQPLIENSIYYGVEKVLTMCRITVTVKEEADCIRMEVQDTGPGMSQEELEAVRSFDFKPKGHGIGLKNIRERLKIAYEENVFMIESRLGEGTKISILIPKRQKEGADV